MTISAINDFNEFSVIRDFEREEEVQQTLQEETISSCGERLRTETFYQENIEDLKKSFVKDADGEGELVETKPVALPEIGAEVVEEQAPVVLSEVVTEVVEEQVAAVLPEVTAEVIEEQALTVPSEVEEKEVVQQQPAQAPIERVKDKVFMKFHEIKPGKEFWFKKSATKFDAKKYVESKFGPNSIKAIEVKTVKTGKGVPGWKVWKPKIFVQFMNNNPNCNCPAA